MSAVVVMVVSLMLDWWLGEARRFHPLVGFGRCAHWLEGQMNCGPQPRARRCLGAVALILLVAPVTLLFAALSMLPGVRFLAEAAALYLALGHRSLHEHAWAVSEALRLGDPQRARHAASRMVSRDSAALDTPAAATESVLENGNDGVFAPLFWFLVAGAPGAACYRSVNTLDAMWGYRTPRFRAFGWAAARLDDLLNYVPARLTALTYASLGRRSTAIDCWRRQAPGWDSPNAGPVMAAGAGALCVTLGGPARYEGQWHTRPTLGTGPAPHRTDIGRSLALVRHGTRLWASIGLLLAGATYA